MERVLPFGAPCDKQCLQFRSGRLFTDGHGPGTTKEQAAQDSKIIEEAGGVDAEAFGLEEGFQFVGKGCLFTKDRSPDWEKQTAEETVKQLQHASWITGVIEPKKTELPLTYLFKTSRGEMGILQLLDIVESDLGYRGSDKKGHGVKLRYKMVQMAEETSAPAPKLNSSPNGDSTALGAAVNAFNELHRQEAAAAGQPTLTEDAVLAAIRSSLSDRSKVFTTDRTFAELGRILDTRILPPGFELELLTRYEPDDKTASDVWSVRLRIPSGVNGWATTCIMIREVQLGSRTIGPEEQKVIRAWREKEKKQGGIIFSELNEYNKERAAAAERDAKTAAASKKSTPPAFTSDG